MIAFLDFPSNAVPYKLNNFGIKKLVFLLCLNEFYAN
jgi:hypothetical protein